MHRLVRDQKATLAQTQPAFAWEIKELDNQQGSAKLGPVVEALQITVCNVSGQGARSVVHSNNLYSPPGKAREATSGANAYRFYVLHFL